MESQKFTMGNIKKKAHMITAHEALKMLQEGNLRFADGKPYNVVEVGRRHSIALQGKQEPFAIILGCSDSRVPAEIVFDQGLGDLFVIRVAGNVVAPSQVGSIEFAASQFRTQLVIVLGHTHCGAVEATIDEICRPIENQSPNLRSIVSRIRPSVEPFIIEGQEASKEDLVDKAVSANIYASVNHLRHGSEILERLVLSGDLMIIGAKYSLQTGVVEFYTEA